MICKPLSRLEVFEIGEVVSVFGEPIFEMRRAGRRGVGLMAGDLSSWSQS
jgi:hypothetical protein